MATLVSETNHTNLERTQLAETVQQAKTPFSLGKRRLWIAIGVCTALVCYFGVRYLIWSAGHEQTDDAYLAAHLHPISSRVTDTVEQVLVDDNQHVAAGQVLVVLDPKDFQVRRDQAQAALAAAERQSDTAQAAIVSLTQSANAQTTEARGAIGEAQAAIAASKAEVDAAASGIPKAQAQLREATTKVEREQTDLDRYENLFAKEQISKQTVDHARADYEVALASQSVAQEQVKQAEAQLLLTKEGVAKTEALLVNSRGNLQNAEATSLETRVRKGQFAVAQAAVSGAEASLEDARLQLSYTVLRAPVSGRIGRKSAETGQRVQVGQPIMAIVEDRPWIVANFKETQLAKMREKQAVQIQIDSFPHHKFSGHVDSLAPGSGNEFALLPSDNATGNFTKIVQRVPVKITLDQESVRGYEGLLSPGMSAVVTVATR
jgi:membrane fusion protein, multidrug efflux system